MKTTSLAAVAAVFALAVPAHAAGEYVTIVQETDLAVPAAAAWGRIKGYCGIGAWMKVSCEITAGRDGELGAVRRIAGRMDEAIVAVTPLSYTYADVDPKILYHGTVEVRPNGATSKLVYSLFYDQSSIPAEQREANRSGRAAMTARLMAAMKGAAEAR